VQNGASPMIQNILVLGAGSAGLLAACALKRKIPQLNVRVVRSPELGVIGVGEGTTPNFPRFLFDFLGISRKKFYELAEPTWKLGIRFFWGPRERFEYGFSLQMDSHWSDLPRPNGYYCEDDFSCAGLPSALMRYDKVFARQPDGAPDIQPWHAFHIENKKFVDVLEILARAAGVEIIDGKVTQAERGPSGIAAVHLEDGRRLEADFFVDASGFRSELLGRALEEPFISYDRSLFCDRAVIGGWDRTTEQILPYTTAETMDAGWAWQIEHEHHINRGYVYSSQAISDDEAAAEFLRKNPKAPTSPRIVKFRSGRYRRQWVDNVVAVGNAGGFVEPLEATALMVVCAECQTLVDLLLHCALKPTETMRRLFNRQLDYTWDDIRDFLALHYHVNTRLDTPFWRHCRADTDVSHIAELLEFYRENGPTGFARYTLPSPENNFGIEGYLVMLVGNRVPYEGKHRATAAEQQAWNAHRAHFISQALSGLDVKEALSYVRHPAWQWNAEVAPAKVPVTGFPMR
jgi:tryptophan 7-halogenase